MSIGVQQFIEGLTFNTDGLIPVIVQEHETHEVLMLAWMNRETLIQTVETQRATYWSRSRGEIWVKGLTSGNTQDVVSIAFDCDADALLMKVHQHGGACHTGARSCFAAATFALVDLA